MRTGELDVALAAEASNVAEATDEGFPDRRPRVGLMNFRSAVCPDRQELHQELAGRTRRKEDAMSPIWDEVLVPESSR
jgi:hypothetical protein